jgi:hypothetical protein
VLVGVLGGLCLIFDLVKDIERELEANVTGNMIPFSRYGINVFKQYDCSINVQPVSDAGLCLNPILSADAWMSRGFSCNDVTKS